MNIYHSINMLRWRWGGGGGGVSADIFPSHEYFKKFSPRLILAICLDIKKEIENYFATPLYIMSSFYLIRFEVHIQSKLL